MPPAVRSACVPHVTALPLIVAVSGVPLHQMNGPSAETFPLKVAGADAVPSGRFAVQRALNPAAFNVASSAVSASGRAPEFTSHVLL